MILSVVIPSYKDPYLNRTVTEFLAGSRLGDGVEVIIVLDGYWPGEIVSDSRVRYVHLGANRGMRQAINAGMAVARGEFIMKTDEHCVFSPGYDKEMVETCQDNWIMVAPRYALDPEKWVLMDGEAIVYEKMTIVDEMRFAGVKWRSRDKARRNYQIDETMAMQGSCWMMKKTWWDSVISEMQVEGYGSFANESQELIFKTWKAGGKLMINKNAWYAHKHRSFKRTHNIGRRENEPGWRYALATWRTYFEQDILPRWS